MENNETWGEKLEELINDIRTNPSTDSVHIHDLVRGLLLSLADKIGGEKQTQEWVDAGENTLLRKQHQVGFNKALDTAISVIKEMVKWED